MSRPTSIAPPKPTAMKSIKALIVTAVTACLLWSCENDTSTLGNTLVSDQTEVVIDSSFTVTLTPYRNATVQSRTTSQLLGNVTAKGFGAIASDFVTQFMPAVKLDTTGVKVEDIDSVKLVLTYNTTSITGDSLVPMGLKIYPLKRQLQSPIYSDLNPADYYDESDCWTNGNSIYTANDLAVATDSGYVYRNLEVKLPVDFGRKVYSQFLANPATFATPAAFADFFPGLYVKSTFGSGRIMNFNNTTIRFYYSKHAKYTNKANQERDTVYHRTNTYLGVTPEIISNNIISYEVSHQLQTEIEAGTPLLVAPLGYNVRMQFPLNEIIAAYRTNGGDMSVINSLSLELPVEEIPNSYSILPPVNLLMILESETESFFSGNKINDDKTSFLATYDSVNRRYLFPSMRQYLIDMLQKSEIAESDLTFNLIPVYVTTESAGSDYYYGSTATYITGVYPYLGQPAMGKLMTSKVKIRFTYSKQSANIL